jgi:gamma-glutamyltranspeptidase/glutathione hydrolase
MRDFTFVSRRSAVLARRGMVATSQPLAAMAGLRALLAGGNAADAAVAAAAMLNVVEPFSTGVGGDCFALVYEAKSGQVTALNGSGRAPAAFTLEEARRLGLEEMPLTGPLTVTVPGTVSGWVALLERFGTMSLGECLAPAIATAEEGFPVSPVISSGWRGSAGKLVAEPDGARIYLPSPMPGDIHRQPELANTLRTVAEGGLDAFYGGRLGEQIASYVQSRGGYLTVGDLASHTATWGTPVRSHYRDVEVLEHPPNGQGLAALVTLNILEGYDLAGMGYFDPQRWHLMIEATRLGLADALQFVADPVVVQVPVAGLLSKAYAAGRRSLIHAGRALPLAVAGQPSHQETVYVTVADPQGNAVSFINSLFHYFGSGLVVPGTGICLQNRGAGFVLEPGHPNALAGGKRPYHTIMPAMALRNGHLWLSFGSVGGFMQPQAQAQILVNMVDYGLDPQTALDAPRFRADQRCGPEVAFEDTVPVETREALAAMGHSVQTETAFLPTYGGGQVIAFDPDRGVLWGGSDPRKDGCALGF